MRLALVHLVGLRNRLFAFLDVAEKAGGGNMISRIAGQLHHNLESPGKLLGDPRHRPRGAEHPDHAGLRRVEDRAGRGASSLPAPAIEPRPVILTARDNWSRMVPSPLRPRGKSRRSYSCGRRRCRGHRPRCGWTAEAKDGLTCIFWTTTCIFWTMSWSHRAARVSA
jgi:hypothetical protein